MNKLLSLLIFTLLFSQFSQAQNKTFKTTELHYGNCPSPSEKFHFTWDEATGVVSEFSWIHGAETWFLYNATPMVSKVIRDTRTLYDYDVYLNVTTAKYKTTAYQIRAKLTLTAMRPDGASFGGVYEGTSTTWIAANGFYSK